MCAGHMHVDHDIEVISQGCINKDIDLYLIYFSLYLYLTELTRLTDWSVISWPSPILVWPVLEL